MPTQMATVRSVTSPWALGAWLAAKGSYVRESRVLFGDQKALLPRGLQTTSLVGISAGRGRYCLNTV